MREVNGEVNGTEKAGMQRMSTGVPNLDLILGGGLPRRALLLVMGVPGSGKTSLASQIGFGAASHGQRVLILTALSESTTKLIEHLRSFRFFDPALIGDHVQFLSVQAPMADGFVALRDAILHMSRQMRADLVVVDGFRGIRDVERDPIAARQFLYDIGTALGALGVTTIVTSEADPHDPSFYPETTTSDVILGLHYALFGDRQRRRIEVIKVRGAAPLAGLHTITLSAEGMHVYPHLEERVALALVGGDAQTQGAAAPRAEAAENVPSHPRVDEHASESDDPVENRVNMGLPELDTLLHGGFARATSTVIAGSLGTGKTLAALHYALAGVRAGERVVYLSLRESPEELVRAATPFGIAPELSAALAPGGGLTLLWVPPIKVEADVIGDRILTALDTVRPARFIVDSIAELERAVTRGSAPGRLEDYLAALMQACRSRGVTSLFIKETSKIGSVTLDFSVDPLSVLAENVVVLQQVAHQSVLHRVLSVVKMRYSAHDLTLREFVIAPPEGIRVLAPFESGAGVLQGIADDQARKGGQVAQSGRPPKRP